ncbi:unannotated protein [freshwater metagenome]|uniref:Unannotated protein n=1 Tax=freshwater metagenome TaxID=449393 RepID=A0A6J7ATN5_9ZZZZ
MNSFCHESRFDGTPNIVSKARGSSGIGMVVSIDNALRATWAGLVPSSGTARGQAESRHDGDAPPGQGDRTDDQLT